MKILEIYYHSTKKNVRSTEKLEETEIVFIGLYILTILNFYL